MSASVLSSLKQNLEKSYILGKLMKLHACMKEYFSVTIYYIHMLFFFRFSMEMAVQLGRSGCSNCDESLAIILMM